MLEDPPKFVKAASSTERLEAKSYIGICDQWKKWNKIEVSRFAILDSYTYLGREHSAMSLEGFGLRMLALLLTV